MVIKMQKKDPWEMYREAIKEWQENFREVLREWQEKLKEWKEQTREDLSKGSLPSLPPLPEIPRISGVRIHGGRSNVVASRINDEDLNKIDMLIEAGLFKTRSEAVAFLVNEGIKARQDLIEKVSSALEEIREIRRQAEERIKKLRRELGLAGGEEEPNRFCPQCGKNLTNLPDDIRVCPYCGSKL